jgi:O-antigen ligase
MPLAIGFQIYSLHYNNISVSMTTFSLAIALSYPFMSSKLNFINFLLFSICFWKYQAIMGFASLVVGFLLFRREKKSLLIIPAMVGILVYDPTIFSFSGREELWPLCLAVWNDIGNFIFGTGGGTFQHFVPLYQHLNGLLFRGTYLRWAHNDFLQILFEQGVVGLSLCVGFFVSMFFRIEKKYWLFMIVLILNMLGNFPLWIASDMLMTALFFKYHLWKEEKCLS